MPAQDPAWNVICFLFDYFQCVLIIVLSVHGCIMPARDLAQNVTCFLFDYFQRVLIIVLSVHGRIMPARDPARNVRKISVIRDTGSGSVIKHAKVIIIIIIVRFGSNFNV